MELNRIGDYIDVFLRACFPNAKGWDCTEDMMFGDWCADYRFEHSDGSLVLVKRMLEPFISSEQIKSAGDILNHCNLLVPNRDSEVILVCGELLIKPGFIPEGIRVISLVDERQMEERDQNLELSLN